MTRPKALLFDLGGVILQVDFGRALNHWAKAAGIDPAFLADRFSHDHAYERHERGEISSAEYFDHLRDHLGLDIDHAAMSEGWNRLLPAEVDGAAAMLAQLAGTVPLYAFSNTNPAHVAYFMTRFETVLQPFDEIFISSSIGHRKPEKQAFHHVCKAVDLAPEDILFFDDTVENVEGARSVGLRSIHVASHTDTIEALVAHGFLPPP